MPIKNYNNAIAAAAVSSSSSSSLALSSFIALTPVFVAVVVKSPKFGPVLFRQIAGALARRIVNYAKIGEVGQQGSDSGFIKFGSRVDVFLPLDAIITVKPNQKVIGAKTVIAEYNEIE